MKAKGIKWFANVSTATEALAAEAAGADVIVVQGIEAGGHRGCFDAASAEAGMVGLFSLLPAIVDMVKVPVVATGGIADARGVAAALLLDRLQAWAGQSSRFARAMPAGMIVDELWTGAKALLR
jgi:nitronate monooxygenase